MVLEAVADMAAEADVEDAPMVVVEVAAEVAVGNFPSVLCISKSYRIKIEIQRSFKCVQCDFTFVDCVM